MWPHRHQTDGFFAAVWAARVDPRTAVLPLAAIHSRETPSPKMECRPRICVGARVGCFVCGRGGVNMLLPDWAVLDAIIDWLGHGLWNLTWWQIVLYTLVTTHITIAAVTIFLHRAQAHRALELHAIPSHFFPFLAVGGHGMQTKEWVAIHRKHHAKCETPDDPHSPQTRGLDTVMWRGAELYRAGPKPRKPSRNLATGTPMTGWSAACTAALAGRAWA